MLQELKDARYTSLSDFMAALNGNCRNSANSATRDEFAHSGHHDRASWYGAGCADGNAVQAKVRDGWQEGRDRMNELRSKLTLVDLAPQDRRRKLIRSDSGDTLDIHSVYAGRLDIAWRTAKRRVTSGPQKIDLCANMICSGGEHADVLFWRGAAAAILTDLLEQAGYMVRLVVNFGGEVVASREKVSCRITVKEHGTPFDITSTSATIMPGFFRGLGHAWVAAHSKAQIHSPSMSVQQGQVEPDEILLSHSIRDHGTALAFVQDTITKINQAVAA